MRLPIAANLRIDQFSGGTITEYDAGMENGIVQTENGKALVTQRPSIDIFEDASTHIADARGRGIFYWDTNSGLYIINNDTVYKNSQSTSIGTITAGTKKCHIFEIGAYLVILDAENDQGWAIDSGDTVTEITDVDFPPKDTPAVGLAYGGAALDNYGYVLAEDGKIHNCDLTDPTAWGALNFKEAEREPDKGVYLAKHHDNLAAFGVRTIEFFYNAANPTGSPLNRRQDVAYNIGCATGESVWEEGDRVFFIASNPSGPLEVRVLEEFRLRKISTDSIDAFLTQAILKDGYSAVGAGLSAQNHTFYILTIYTTPSNVSPTTTLVYDDNTGLWGTWETTLGGLSNFPLVAWTKRDALQARYGEGIFSNGDLMTINDNFNPQDTVLGSKYIADGYVNTGYVLSVTETGTPITWKARLGQSDFGTRNYKFGLDMGIVGDLLPNSANITITRADENNTSFGNARTIDLSKDRREHSLGRFRRRNHHMEYSGTDPIRLEAFDLNVNVSNR